MKRRTSILLEQEQYERLESRARRRGHTMSEEIRETLGRSLSEENPNQGLLDLIGIASGAGKPASWIDSDEFRDEMAEAAYSRTEPSPK